MDVSLENVAIAFFFVLPGFISAGIRRMARPSQSESIAGWVVTCVVASLTMNAVVLATIIVSSNSLNLDQSISDILDQLKKYTGRQAGYYVEALYLLAIAWGLATAALWRWRPQQLAFLLRLTPIMPDDDVFNPTFNDLFRGRKNLAEKDPSKRLVPWVRVSQGQMTVIGRMNLSSVTVEQDKPIEIHLNPAFQIVSGVIQEIPCPPGAKSEGVYLRVRPEDMIEIFSAPQNWP